MANEKNETKVEFIDAEGFTWCAIFGGEASGAFLSMEINQLTGAQANGVKLSVDIHEARGILGAMNHAIALLEDATPRHRPEWLDAVLGADAYWFVVDSRFRGAFAPLISQDGKVFSVDAKSMQLDTELPGDEFYVTTTCYGPYSNESWPVAIEKFKMDRAHGRHI